MQPINGLIPFWKTVPQALKVQQWWGFPFRQQWPCKGLSCSPCPLVGCGRYGAFGRSSSCSGTAAALQRSPGSSGWAQCPLLGMFPVFPPPDVLPPHPSPLGLQHRLCLRVFCCWSSCLFFPLYIRESKDIENSRWVIIWSNVNIKYFIHILLYCRLSLLNTVKDPKPQLNDYKTATWKSKARVCRVTSIPDNELMMTDCSHIPTNWGCLHCSFTYKIQVWTSKDESVLSNYLMSKKAENRRLILLLT